MKRKFILSVLTLSFLYSCQSDEFSKTEEVKKEVEKFNPEVFLPSKSLLYDYSSYSQKNQKTTLQQ